MGGERRPEGPGGRPLPSDALLRAARVGGRSPLSAASCAASCVWLTAQIAAQLAFAETPAFQAGMLLRGAQSSPQESASDCARASLLNRSLLRLAFSRVRANLTFRIFSEASFEKR